MRVESVDFYYLSVDEVKPIGDGSQDALLVRLRAGDFEGWGECEAAPLVSIASFVCPMSHSACRPVRDGIVGQSIDSPKDIRRINALVRSQSFDLLQADHTLSGIDCALWDLLGNKCGEPVYKLLGFPKAHPKTAYASQLFGDTAEATYAKALRLRESTFRAAKFGWGPYGTGSAKDDADQVHAARAGVGPEIDLMVDAGTAWGEDVRAAESRIQALRDCHVLWLEEPFATGALSAYAELSRLAAPIALAAGEGAHTPDQAKHLIDFGRIGYIQIDAGRIGGITSAFDVARYAADHGVKYVNHTFTTALALSASLQPYAGFHESSLCEYPVESSELARALTSERIEIDLNGCVEAPDRPGLGMTPNLDTMRRYLQRVSIVVNEHTLYESPAL